MISEYIRKKNGEKVGIMVAITDDFNQVFSIGWSTCNTKKDEFNLTAAINMATVRAESALRGKDVFYGKKLSDDGLYVEEYPKYPSFIVDKIENFLARAKTYYKDKEHVANNAI